MKIEHALLTGGSIGGVSLDYTKCFDRVPHEVMLRLVSEMGLPLLLVRPIRAMYQGLRRRFRVGASVGQAFLSTNGILQGCPLSVVLFNALASVWLEAISCEVRDALPHAYADDVGAILRRRKDVQTVADITGAFAAMTG